MIIRNINLETVCGITSKLPENTLPEIAFAGKSNVGKSSLINALMNRKSYARISATPGKAQTINFYNINEELYLVDLPGYGYAKVSEQEKIKWGQLIERYLHTSGQWQSRSLQLAFPLTSGTQDSYPYDPDRCAWFPLRFHPDPNLLVHHGKSFRRFVLFHFFQFSLNRFRWLSKKG